MRSPPGSLIISFARPVPADTFRIGGLGVWAESAIPPKGAAASASTKARRPRPALTIPTSGKGPRRGLTRAGAAELEKPCPRFAGEVSTPALTTHHPAQFSIGTHPVDASPLPLTTL